MRQFFLTSIIATVAFPLSLFALTNSQPALDIQWDSIVQIRTEAVDTDGSAVPAYCNGTLLSPRIILTAAHCVVEAQVLKSFEVEVAVGAYKYVTRPDGKVFRAGYVTKVKQTLPADFYFTASMNSKIQSSKLKADPGPGDDMAIIVLKTNLPLEQSFPYAKVIGRADFQGLKNIVTQYIPSVVTINFFEQMSTDTKRIATLDQLTFKSSHYFTSKSIARVQAGDSGGPLFTRVGPNWKIVGVVKGKASTFFSNWDVYAATDSNLCEIGEGVIKNPAMANSATEIRNLLCP